MATPFTLTFDACQPDEHTYAEVTISGPGGNQKRVIWDTSDCKLACPYSEEELKAICPNPEDRVKIYAWDPINQFEAEDEQEKIQHEQDMERNGGAYGWFYDCEKCFKCEDLGRDSYFESHYCKCAENNPDLIPISCPGAMIGPITLRSSAFNKDCLKFYDVYAKVNLTADNWGTVFGAGGIITCSNEGTTQCNNKCINQKGDIQCFIEDYFGYIDAQDNPQDDEPNRARAKIFADATNSSNGGSYALDVRADFYFKLKPKNK